MKRLVFGLAIAGLLFVIAPALLNAGEDQRSLMLNAPPEATLDALEATLGQLPLALTSSNFQLVDHCYRGGSYGYRSHHHHHHHHRAYSPYDSYAPRLYQGYGGHGRSYGGGIRGYGGGYHMPRSSYYGRGAAYPQSRIGFYIGF